MTWTKGDIMHGIFMDVKSAFDEVWHKGLLAKKKKCKTYLSNRQQIVVVDGKFRAKKK